VVTHDRGDRRAELVLDLVCDVPPGRVTTYGDLARLASDVGPTPVTARMVGRMLGGSDRDVPWWRVVGHDGRLPPGLETSARARLVAEGCPMLGSRADVRAARWPG
jgi:methylated-DNA-protein-cysteine methyltransferase related protein